MKAATIFLALAFNLFFAYHAVGQQSDKALIKSLEERERIAIVKGNIAELNTLMSKNIIVQNPENTIVGFNQIIDRIKIGKINYYSFVRRIDSIAFVNGVAVVMGLETVITNGSTDNAGKTLQRRFTNIWNKEKGTWKLTARQATIVSNDQ